MPDAGALAGGIEPAVPAPPVELPALPVPELPADPLVLSLPVLGGVEGGVVVLPVLPEELPEVVPGERVLPVSVGSDLPQALNTSRELKTIAKAGLKLKVFMGLPFEKFTLKTRLGLSAWVALLRSCRSIASSLAAGDRRH